MRNWEVELHLGAPNGSAPRAAKPFNRMGFEVEADGGGSAGSEEVLATTETVHRSS